MSERGTYRFGPFRLDRARRTFQREAEYIQLPPKVFSCMVYLLEHRERAVSHEELLNAVWGTEHFSAGVIPQTVLQMRKALEGGETEYIQSIRGFGYRWMAPVESGEPEAPEEPAEPEPQPEEPVDPAAAGMAPAAPEAVPAQGSRPARRRVLLWTGVLAAVLGALIAVGLYLYRQRAPEPTLPITDGSVALLLPVTVDAAPEDAWIRLGVMDFVAERLRAAGLNMVSSDTVIALLDKQGGEMGQDGYERLTRVTGARLALTARAQQRGTRWVVSLQVVKGAQPPLSAAGEAGDVIEAARLAADSMASSLGLRPQVAPGVDPALVRLSQQIRAVLLTGDVAAAGELLENAPAALRRHPEIRFVEGQIALMGIRLDAAQAIFESLLRENERDPAGDPLFRAKLLSGIGTIQVHRNDWSKAESLLERAVAMVGDEEAPAWAGVARLNLSAMASIRGDLEAASGQLEHARRNFSSRSDLSGLAAVDTTMALIEDLRERPGYALRYRQSATERLQALGDRPSELGTRALLQGNHLQLLDIGAAAAQQPRIRELSAQVTEPRQLQLARLTEAMLANAQGRLAHSEAQLGAALEISRAYPDLAWSAFAETFALAMLADQALRDGRFGRASALAARVVGDSHEANVQERASAWLTLMRSQLAVEKMAGARESVAALRKLAGQKPLRQVAIPAHLAQAELAAAEGNSAAAAAAYQQALDLAEAGQEPALVLDVIASYLPWWLDEHGASGVGRERAVQLAGRVASYADDWFEAALVRLRLYHALGDATAWRAALEQAHRLAGERRIPQELQTLPTR